MKKWTEKELLKFGKFDDNPKMVKSFRVVREKVKIIREPCGDCKDGI